jgi:lipid II:glycine glycyltransferase (peptidoglycan interpeptide bridge formation enzyme)
MNEKINVAGMRITDDPSAVGKKEWEDYVLRHPDSNPFQAPGMYETYLDTENYEPVLLLAVRDSGRLAGVLLAVIQKEGSILLRDISSRSVIFGGPLADDHQTLRALLERYMEVIRGRAVYSQVRNFRVPDNETVSVYRDCGFLFEDHLNIRVDLTISPEAFWKGIKQNRKAGINKARKQGFRFSVTRDSDIIEPFYGLLKSTYKYNRLPFPDISFFRSLSARLHSELLWFVLERESVPGIVLAALLSKETLYIYYPGIDQSSSFLRLRPVDLFYYEVMRWGQENGVKVLDWMGAGKPGKEYGVRYFKQQYGGELFNPGRFQAVHRPVLMLAGRTGLTILKLLKRRQ